MKLKQACLLHSNYGLNISAGFYTESGIPIIRTSDFDDYGNLDLADAKYVTEDVAKAKILKKGDVLFSRSGTIGRSLIINDNTKATYAAYLVRFRANPSLLLNRFLFFWSQSSDFYYQIAKDTIFTTIGNFNAAKFANLEIELPSINAQIEIADFLDRETAKIDALITEQQRLIELLKEKRQAVISHAVTKGLNPNTPMKPSGVEWLGEVPEHWEIISIKWLSPVKRGASPRPIDDLKYFDDEGEFAWVRIADVSACDGELRETTQRLSELGSSLSVKIEPGELFVSISGTVGKPCLSAIKTCIHDGFVYFPDLKINPKFLYWIFEGGTCYGGLGKWGTQLNLNTDTIGSIRIALPPPDEFDLVLAFLKQETEKIDALTTKAQHTINLLQERRAALITAAVTGQIDVKTHAKSGQTERQLDQLQQEAKR